MRSQETELLEELVMNEKDRILELVQKGIISSEEAVELLEQLGKKVAQQQNVSSENSEGKVNFETDFTIHFEDNDATKGEIDELIEQHEEMIDQLEDDLEDKGELFEALGDEMEHLEEEIEKLEEVEPLSNEQKSRLQQLKDKLADLQARRDKIEDEIDTQVDLIEEKRKELEALLKKLKRKIEDTDWEQTTKDSISQIGELVGRFAGQFAKAVSETVRNVSDTIQFDNNLKNYRPSQFKSKTAYQFSEEMKDASIVEVKVANGDLRIKTAEQDKVTVNGELRIDGDFETQAELDAFVQERVHVQIEQDTFIFAIPSKKIYADVTIVLPTKMYDYVAAKGLNTTIRLKELQGKDFYLESRNGDVSLKDVHGTMLEVDSTNGNVAQFGGTFKDILVKIMNGNVLVDGEVVSADLQNINGNIKVRLSNQDTKKVSAKTVNGNVTFEVAPSLEIEADLKTSLGSLKYDKDVFEVLRQEKDTISQAVVLQKQANYVPVQLRGRTTTGSVKLIQVQYTNE